MAPVEAAPDETAEATNSQGKPHRNPFSRSPKSEPSVLTCIPENDDPPAPPLFRILPVTLYGPQREAETYALLDEGSAFTLIDEDLSE